MKHPSRNFLTVFLLYAPLLVSAQGALDNRRIQCGALESGVAMIGILRDNGISQSDAVQKYVKLTDGLPKDNRDFIIRLNAEDAKIAYGFPGLSKTSLQTIAGARCGRILDGGSNLSFEDVAALVPAILKCQSKNDNNCISSMIYEPKS